MVVLLSWLPTLLLLGCLFLGFLSLGASQGGALPKRPWLVMFIILWLIQAGLTWPLAKTLPLTSPLPTAAIPWHHGPILQQVTVLRWQKSAYESQLATAYHWLLEWQQEQRLHLVIHAQTDYRPWAEALRKCIQHQSLTNHPQQPILTLVKPCQSRVSLEKWMHE